MKYLKTSNFTLYNINNLQQVVPIAQDAHSLKAGFHCDAADKSGSAQLVFYCFQNTMLLQQPLEPCALLLCFTFYISAQPPHSLCIWIIIKMSYKSSERSAPSTQLPSDSQSRRTNGINSSIHYTGRSEISHTKQFFVYRRLFGSAWTKPSKVS